MSLFSLVFFKDHSNLKNPQGFPIGYRTKPRVLGMPFKTIKSKSPLAHMIFMRCEFWLVTAQWEGWVSPPTIPCGRIPWCQLQAVVERVLSPLFSLAFYPSSYTCWVSLPLGLCLHMKHSPPVFLFPRACCTFPLKPVFLKVRALHPQRDICPIRKWLHSGLCYRLMFAHIFFSLDSSH